MQVDEIVSFFDLKMVFFYPSTRLLSRLYYAAPFRQNFLSASLLELSSSAEKSYQTVQILRLHQPKPRKISFLAEDMAVSKIRTNFHPNSEAMINKQINMELHASYVYMSMVITDNSIVKTPSFQVLSFRLSGSLL